LLLALVLFGDRLLLSAPEKGEIRFAHTFTNASEAAVLNDAIAEFESLNPGTRIAQMVSDSDSYGTIGWRIQFQNRRQPDLYFQWGGIKVDTAVERGWALDLRPHLSDTFRAAFVPAAFDSNGPDAPIYLLPHSVELCNLVWHDRDTFDALGFEAPQTIERWLDQCARLRERGRLPLAQGNRDLWPMGNMAAELLAQTLGPSAVSKLYEPATPVSPPDISGLGALLKLRDGLCFELEGVLGKGGIGSISDDDAKVLFLSGQATQHVVGSWLLADVQDARSKGELKFNVDFFPIPSPAGKPDAIGAVTTGYVVNPNSKNVPATVAFLELLLSRKYQARFAALGVISLRKDAAEFTKDPLTQRMIATLASSKAIVAPSDTAYPAEQADVAYTTVGKLLTGDLATLEDAARYWSAKKTLLAKQGR
jgi:ABC-type glycerol-3-phosphate transport system substrate-binding protein